MEPRASVHLSGPDYSPEEADGMAALAAVLERNGIETWLRARDGIGSVLTPSTFSLGDPAAERQSRRVLESAAFALEIYRVARVCDCLVFNMNGRVPDDGGAFLAGAAFTLGKPVILYKRDHRTKLYGNDNAMISGLSFDFKAVSEAARLPGEVEKAIGRYGDRRPVSQDVPPLVRLNAELGLQVSESLDRFKASGSKTDPMDLFHEISKACDASQAFNLRA